MISLTTVSRHARRLAHGRRARRCAVLLVALIAALQVLLAAAASADPGGCHQPPQPEHHGEGVVGALDPAPLGYGTVGSPYYEQGYAGQTWYTYGTSGVCSMSYPWAGADTWLGNQELAAAESITAATNGLHQITSENGLLPKLDGLVLDLPVVLYDSVFTPYFAVVMLISAVMVFGWAFKGDLSSVGKKAFWTLAGLAFASLTYLMPMVYAPISDGLLVHGTNELQSNILRSAGWSDRDALPTMLHTETVYRPWLVGEFGSDTSPEAQRYGRDLLRAQGCTKDEELLNTCNTEQKQAAYTNIADQIQNTPAYKYFSGDKGRTSAGALALVKAGCYGLFQLVVQAGLVLMQLICRGVIIAGPILGLLAILKNDVLPRILRALGSAVGMGILLVITGTIHAYVMAWISAPERGFAEGEQLTVMVLVTALLWISVRPWRTLRSMAASTVGLQLPDPAQERMARRLRQRRRRMVNIGKSLFGKARNMGFDHEFWMQRGDRDPAGSAGSGSSAQSGAPGGEVAHRVGASRGGQERPEGRIYATAHRVPTQDTAPEREPAMATHGRAGELTEGPRALEGGGGPPDDPPPSRGPRGPRGGPSGPTDSTDPAGPTRSGGDQHGPPRPPQLPEGGPRESEGPSSSPRASAGSSSEVVIPSEIEFPEHRRSSHSRTGQPHPRTEPSNDESGPSPSPSPYRPEEE